MHKISESKLVVNDKNLRPNTCTNAKRPVRMKNLLNISLDIPRSQAHKQRQLINKNFDLESKFLEKDRYNNNQLNSDGVALPI